MAGKRKTSTKLSREDRRSKKPSSSADKVEEVKPENAGVLKEEIELNVNKPEDAINVNKPEDATMKEETDKIELKVNQPEETNQPQPPVVGEDEGEGESRFLGRAVPAEEARRRWPHRYHRGSPKNIVQARRHFLKAEVDGQVFSLEDDASVKGADGLDFICKIIEFFEAVDGCQNFTAQWFYTANDTVIQSWCHLIDDKRVFFSEIKDANPLDCLIKKINIKMVSLKVELHVNDRLRAACDYYCDKKYLLPYSSFVNIQPDCNTTSGETGSTISSDAGGQVGLPKTKEGNVKTLLDLYSGCGAMSTGLCLGAESGGVKLVTKWAVDINKSACECLKLNHPETEVRNEAAENFLSLLKEWEKLGSLLSSEDEDVDAMNDDSDVKDEEEDDDPIDDGEIFEVDEILSICYGDMNKKGKSELHFKIRWKGYGPAEDTWEPMECLSSCQEKLKKFVSNGYKSRILPLPGTVDVICGGPPCQGISGHNRFRNKEAPLDDPKNKQLIVYMDIVEYLKPKFVLMENVVDILKFAHGYLGRYALGRLVSMGYQARMGMMAAGAYGLPQFRMRMFMWGALPSEKLPQYPLPTHNAIYRGVTPVEFEANNVMFDDGANPNLKKELYLADAISDLPPVENNEERDELPYDLAPQTEFQRFIRLRRDEMPGCTITEKVAHSLYDHRPLLLNRDDYDRVCQIPKRKGANFRDLRGVKVRHDNRVEWDPNVERVKLVSGKPLVPDYAMTYVKGSSSKPFGRLWWDETVSTVVTRAEPHNQVILHPMQDRVLTVRENARLQGFPDYYKLVGNIKERYVQVGNAVAVPVARALGYSLAKALRGLSEDDPVFTLPEDYPFTKDGSVPADVTM